MSTSSKTARAALCRHSELARGWKQKFSSSRILHSQVVQRSHISTSYRSSSPSQSESGHGFGPLDSPSISSQVVRRSLISRSDRPASSQGAVGHGFTARYKNCFRSFASQVVPNSEIPEGKIEKSAVVGSAAEGSSQDKEEVGTGGQDAGNTEDIELEDEALEGQHLDGVLPGNRNDNNKSLLSLWQKIEKVGEGPQVSVIPLIKEWLAEGNALDKTVLVTILVRLRRRTRYRQAMEISDWMSEEHDLKWEVMDNIVRIDLKAKMRQFRIAEFLFEHSPSEFKTEMAYHTLLKNYCRHHMVDKAEELLTKLKQSGLLTRPFPFNQMMLLYKHKGMEHRFSEVLEDMKTFGVKRDIYTYNILMDARARSGDISGMEAAFEELKSDELVEADAASYGTLATAYIHVGKSEKAKEFLKLMEEGDFNRNRPSYDILVAHYGALGDSEGVERVWAIIKEMSSISNRSYVTAIESFGKLGMVEQAEQIYKEMVEDKGVRLTRQFNALLSVYIRGGMMEEAEKLFQEMVALGRKRNAITFHHMVTGYLKKNRLDKALEMVKEAQNESNHGRTKPWLATLTSILEAFAQKGDVVNAETHFRQLKKAYPKPTVHVYNSLLKAYINARVPAIGFLQRMTGDNAVPNDETLHLLKQQTGQTQESDVFQTQEAIQSPVAV